MEDKNFYNNYWIDFSAIWRAIINNFKTNKKIEWASTISTQVIRNNYWLNSKRWYSIKFAEFYMALVLNTKYSKNKILEYYLNNIYYWHLNYWINSASYYYFWKDINNITKAEQLSILILPKNPLKYDPYKNRFNFKQRFEKIAKYLKINWLISQKELDSILSEKLIFNNNHTNKLPYIIDFIKKENINSHILDVSSSTNKWLKTTINYNLTKKIDQIAKNIIEKLAWKDVWDYGIIITNIKNNDLKVMIGWVDYYAENWQVNSTTALRQVGSTLKPFTYLLSFKDLWYKANTKILDLPIQFETVEWNTYAPKNYSLDYKWEVFLAQALSQSLNIPAVKLTNEIWLNRLYNFLKKLKISSLNKPADYYWLALTLWVAEMNLFELLQAYSIFTNNWNLCKINILLTNQNNYLCENIIEKKYIDEIKMILTNRYFKLRWFPINSNLDFKDRYVFVKTGTSRNFRDNWSIGFTRNYMIWVWVWNKNWTYMKWVSWATWAWEIFSKIVKYLEPVEKDFWQVAKVFKQKKEDFIVITSPLNNSIYKIDRTKPKNIAQIKIDFETNISYDKVKYYKNNQKLNSNFIKLEKWISNIKIILYKNWKQIWKKSSTIKVE
jgi:membrane carboxypeptidase/penicillin-binding protein PbpC